MKYSTTVLLAYVELGLITETTPTSQFKDNQDGTVTDVKNQAYLEKMHRGSKQHEL